MQLLTQIDREKEASKLIKEFYLRSIEKEPNIENISNYKEAISYLCKHFINDSEDYKKGVALIGNPGLGKSFVISKLTDLFYPTKQYSKILLDGYVGLKRKRPLVNSLTASDLVYKFNIEGFAYYDSIPKECSLFIDEIGMEPEGFSYGTKCEVFKDFIHRAYSEGRSIHLTSNLSVDQMAKRYGLDVIDRIKTMSRLFVFEGESLRK